MTSDVWPALAGGAAARMPLFAFPSLAMRWTVRPAIWQPTLRLCQLIEALDESDPACQTQTSTGSGSQFSTLPVNRPSRKRMTPISTVSQVLSPAPWPDSAAYNLSLLTFFLLPSPCPTSIFFPRLLPCCPPPPPCTPPPLGCLPATVLKPDEGTADLPAGRVRLCIDADGSITEVGEEHIHRVSPRPPCLLHPPSPLWRVPRA